MGETGLDEVTMLFRFIATCGFLSIGANVMAQDTSPLPIDGDWPVIYSEEINLEDFDGGFIDYGPVVLALDPLDDTNEVRGRLIVVGAQSLEETPPGKFPIGMDPTLAGGQVIDGIWPIIVAPGPTPARFADDYIEVGPVSVPLGKANDPVTGSDGSDPDPDGSKDMIAGTLFLPNNVGKANDPVTGSDGSDPDPKVKDRQIELLQFKNSVLEKTLALPTMDSN